MVKKFNSNCLIAIKEGGQKIVFLNNGTYQTFDFNVDPKDVHGLIRSANEYLITTSSGVFKITNRGIEKIFSYRHNVKAFDSVNNVFWVFRDNSLFALRSLDESDNQLIVPKVVIRSTLKDRFGVMWFGTAGRGFFKINNFPFKTIGETLVAGEER